MAGISNAEYALAGLLGGAGNTAGQMEMKQAYLNALLQRAREQSAARIQQAGVTAAGNVAGATNKGVNAAIVDNAGRTTDTGLRDTTAEDAARLRAAVEAAKQRGDAAKAGAKEGAAINAAREAALQHVFPGLSKGATIPQTVPWASAQEANSLIAQNLGQQGYHTAPYFVSQTAQPSTWDALVKHFGGTPTPQVQGVVNPKFPSDLVNLSGAVSGTGPVPNTSTPGTPARPKVATQTPAGFSVQQGAPLGADGQPLWQ